MSYTHRDDHVSRALEVSVNVGLFILLAAALFPHSAPLPAFGCMGRHHRHCCAPRLSENTRISWVDAEYLPRSFAPFFCSHS